ncbi:MAG: hypothetical protein MJ193_01715 [Clostridia bacterium]|nr:hypothetical protein [Clostridia bacterium]
MATIGTAYVQIMPSMEGIGKNLESSLGGQISNVGASTGNKFASGFSKAVGVGAMAVGAVTVAVGATVGAMGNAIAKTAQYGDEIDKNSQKLGISSQAYQEWSAVLEHSGTSIDAMGTTFRKLATESQNASAEQVEAFSK